MQELNGNLGVVVVIGERMVVVNGSGQRPLGYDQKGKRVLVNQRERLSKIASRIDQ